VDPCCNVVDDGDFVFVDSQGDEKLQVLEPDLKNRYSDLVVYEALEIFVINTIPVRLCSTIYGVAVARPFV